MKLTANEMCNLVQVSNNCTARRFAIVAMDYIERFKLLRVIFEQDNPQYVEVNIKDIFCHVFTRMCTGSNNERYSYNMYWADSKKYSDEDVVMSEVDFERCIDNIKKNPNIVEGTKKEMLKALYRIIKSRGFDIAKQRTGVYIKGVDTDGASLDWIDYDGTIKITWNMHDE